MRSMVTLSAFVMDALFAHNWRVAEEYLAKASEIDIRNRMPYNLNGGAMPVLPHLVQPPVNLLGNQFTAQYKLYDDGQLQPPAQGGELDVAREIDNLTEEMQAKLDQTSQEWAELFGQLMQEINPVPADFGGALTWLTAEAPHLGDISKDQFDQALAQAPGYHAQRLVTRGVYIPAPFAAGAYDVQALDVAAPVLSARAGALDAEKAMSARFLTEGVSLVLDAWHQANDVVRKALLDRMQAQFAGASGGSMYAAQRKVEALADRAALRLEGSDLSRYSAMLSDSLSESADGTRRSAELNKLIRARMAALAEGDADALQFAAQQARAALNANGFSVGSGLSERREIDKEG